MFEPYIDIECIRNSWHWILVHRNSSTLGIKLRVFTKDKLNLTNSRAFDWQRVNLERRSGRSGEILMNANISMKVMYLLQKWIECVEVVGAGLDWRDS